MKPIENFRTFLLYTKKGIPLGPGVHLFLLLLTIRLISSRVGGFVSNFALGRLAKPNCHYVPEGYIYRDQNTYLLNVSPELFSLS